MALGAVWTAALLGHNGVVHKPGEASAIGVSEDHSCATECITIYNYGQNYVKQFDTSDGSIQDLWWPTGEMPIAASIIDTNKILALADTPTGNKFKLYDTSQELGTELSDASCELGEKQYIKFVDSIDSKPTFINLMTGTVSSFSGTAADSVCTDEATFVTTNLGDPLFKDALFYGFAQNSNYNCWFLGTKDDGARVECENRGNSNTYTTKRLDDGYRRNNDHTGGDIFFGTGNILNVANGDTDPGNLREGRQQHLGFTAGKLLKFTVTDSKVGDEGTIVSVGFRNPWTTAKTTNERFVGHVGQQTCETVYKIDTTTNQNFGWPKYEGRFFRSAVTPYKRNYADAERVFTDSHRSLLPANFMFVLYILFFLLFAIGIGLVAYRRSTGAYETFTLEAVLLLTYLCVGLPQMTSSPGYTGNDNGVYATHMRFLVHSFSPKYNETYDEYFVMVFFLFFAGPLLISAVYWSSPHVAAAGSLFAFVYLVTFMALVEAPAVITPLPVFAFVFVVATAYLAFKQIKHGGAYAKISEQIKI